MASMVVTWWIVAFCAVYMSSARVYSPAGLNCINYGQNQPYTDIHNIINRNHYISILFIQLYPSPLCSTVWNQIHLRTAVYSKLRLFMRRTLKYLKVNHMRDNYKELSLLIEVVVYTQMVAEICIMQSDLNVMVVNNLRWLQMEVVLHSWPSF